MTRKQFNAFWVYANLEVWPTTQINKEQCHVCMGKSARRSIPNHQEHDQFDNSAQMLWVASETTIQYNASESGLAVTLLQNGQPVAFVSRSLSAVERRYARNNRKRLHAAVSISICVEENQWQRRQTTSHWCQYSRSLQSTPKQQRQMLLWLQKYNLHVKYLSGSQMYIADMLSRAYLQVDHSQHRSIPEYQPWAIIVSRDC